MRQRGTARRPGSSAGPVHVASVRRRSGWCKNGVGGGVVEIVPGESSGHESLPQVVHSGAQGLCPMVTPFVNVPGLLYERRRGERVE